MTEIKTVEEWLGADNQLGIDILKNKYTYNNETFPQWIERVSGGNKDIAKLILEKKFLFGGRTLTNRGTNIKGSYSNCYSSGFVKDSLDDIMKTNTELALTYKAQGGQGLSLTKLRPKGTPVGNGEYTSDGIVPFMKLFNQTTESISQGGCIFGEELVLTKDGYKKIADIEVGDFVWTKKGYIEVNYVFDKGEQDIYQVKTKKGYKIRTTLDHKFAINGFDTKQLSELKVGDKINIITKNTENYNFEPLSYFLGYFNGNGWVSEKLNNGSLTMHWDQTEICDRLIKIINDLGFEANINGELENSFRRIHLNKDLIDYLDNLGLIKNKTKDIEVPEIIMNGTDTMVISYISGALDSDGCVYKSSFKYNTISEKYANQMMLLLNRIGFFPSLHMQIRNNKCDLYEIVDSFRPNQPKLYSIKKDNKSTKYADNSKLRTPYTIEKLNLDRNLHKHLKKIGKSAEIGLFTYINATVNREYYSPIILDEILNITYCGKGHVYDISLIEEHLFNCNGIYVSNSRKGALLMSLDAWHKQIEEFITIKSDLNEINKANLSVEIDDEFMEVVDNDLENDTETTIRRKETYGKHEIEYDIIPIKIFRKLAELSWDNGEPAPIYVDKFRNYNIMEFVDGYQIEICNPCLHPDTLIQTTEGLIKIKDISKPMKVYSMDENEKLVISNCSPSWITKKNTELIELFFNNGDSIKVTPDHKIYTRENKWIRADQIKIGDTPISLMRKRRGNRYSSVRLSSQKSNEYVMEHRLIYKAHFGKIKDSCDIHHIDSNTYNNNYKNLEEIPHNEHATLTRLSCDNNHMVNSKVDGKFISTEKSKHGKKEIIELPDHLNTKFKYYPKIVAIKKCENSDVYDIIVENTHNFIANGIIVHNCGEQPLPKYGACNLGSINLSEFVINPYTEWAVFDYDEFENAVKIAITGLDEVLDEGIKLHALKEQQEMAKNYRNIGLGIMGLGSMFFKLGITYGEKTSKKLLEDIMKLMFRTAVLQSNKLAKEKGTFPKYSDKVWKSTIIENSFNDVEIEELKKDGLRNCSLLSIAPSGSIGTLLNVTTGCEPAFAIKYQRKTESLHKDTDVYYDVYIAEAKEFMELHNRKELPDYFISSAELNWRDRVEIQAILQEYVDTSISSTVNLPKSATVEDIMSLYVYAWKSGCKGITVFREGCKRVGVLTTNAPKEEIKQEDKKELPWGTTIIVNDDVMGKKRKLTTGCGSLHCTAFFDTVDGRLMEMYLSKGSTGGCNNFMTGLSRMISHDARTGGTIESIVDQLMSSGTCPSYSVRKATKNDTSKGSSCPVAIGYALMDMYKEIKDELGLDDEEELEMSKVKNVKKDTKDINQQFNICPSCNDKSLIYTGNCNSCVSCGYTKCE